MKKSLTRRSFASGTIFTVVPPFFKSIIWLIKQKADIPIGISATNSTFLDPIRRVLLSISFPCNVRSRHPLLTFALHLANPFPKNYLAVSHHPGSLCRIELRYSFWSSIFSILFLTKLRLLLSPEFVKYFFETKGSNPFSYLQWFHL